MDKVRILVVEDEIVIADNICDILEELGYDVLEPAINYSEAITTIEDEKPDLALLDIQLAGKKDGIDIARKIKETYNFPFIFLTSNADPRTIERAKHLNPPAYLVKPFNRDDLYTSIELALFNYSKKTSHLELNNKTDDLMIKDAIFIKNKNMFYKVLIKDIIFLKSDHVYIEVYTTNGEKYLIRDTLTHQTEKLPKNFFRSHRSYTVNLDYLEAINSMKIIASGHEIPIGKNYRSELMNRIRIE